MRRLAAHGEVNERWCIRRLAAHGEVNKGWCIRRLAAHGEVLHKEKWLKVLFLKVIPTFSIVSKCWQTILIISTSKTLRRRVLHTCDGMRSPTMPLPNLQSVMHALVTTCSPTMPSTALQHPAGFGAASWDHREPAYRAHRHHSTRPANGGLGNADSVLVMPSY